MKYLAVSKLKINFITPVILAKAEIQTGDMPSLMSIKAKQQQLQALHSSKNVNWIKLWLNWIPACAGMTECEGSDLHRLGCIRISA